MDSHAKPIVVYVCRRQDKDSAGKFTRFFDSYKQHPAGHEHDLIIIKKGFRDHENDWKQWTAQISGIPFELREYPDKNYVFGYVRNLMEEFPDRYILVLNATSEILVDHWLDFYMRHAAPKRLLGACGNYFSWNDFPEFTLTKLFRSSRRSRKRLLSNLTIGLSSIPEAFYDGFHPYPNPNLRTTGFMIPPRFLESIAYWPKAGSIRSKNDEHLFEAGIYGLSMQTLLHGYELLVVGADGRCYPINEWCHSHCFFSSNQENLVIGDHITKKYAKMSTRQKATASRQTWREKSISQVGLSDRLALSENMDKMPCPFCEHVGYTKQSCQGNHDHENNDDTSFSHSWCSACGTIAFDRKSSDNSRHAVENRDVFFPQCNKTFVKGQLELIRPWLKSKTHLLQIGRNQLFLTDAPMPETRDITFHTVQGTPDVPTWDIPVDMIWGHNIIEQLTDIHDFLASCTAKLNRGGIFILTLVDPEGCAYGISRDLSFFPDAGNYTLIPEKTLIPLVESYGFKVERIVRRGTLAKIFDRYVWKVMIEGYLSESKSKISNSFIKTVFQCCSFFAGIIYFLNRKTARWKAIQWTWKLLYHLERLIGTNSFYSVIFSKT